MTEKQFIIQFLGITEQDYDTLLINPKLMCEMLEAYQKEMNPEKYFGRNTLSSSQSGTGGITTTQNVTPFAYTSIEHVDEHNIIKP